MDIVEVWWKWGRYGMKHRLVVRRAEKVTGRDHGRSWPDRRRGGWAHALWGRRVCAL